MEKVKLTKAQADAIEWALSESTTYKNGPELLLQNHGHSQFTNELFLIRLEPLNSLNTLNLAKALIVGYEVEPEFKVGDWVVHDLNKKTQKIIRKANPASGDCGKFILENEKGVLPAYLRHATPEEIKQEKERRFWKGLGREVNEYKIGDVVSTGSITRPIETIWKEAELSLEGMGMSNYYKLDEIFMVCPVEKRLDVNANE